VNRGRACGQVDKATAGQLHGVPPLVLIAGQNAGVNAKVIMPSIG